MHGDGDGGDIVAKRPGTFRFHARLTRTSSVALLGKTDVIKTSRGLLVDEDHSLDFKVEQRIPMNWFIYFTSFTIIFYPSPVNEAC